MAGTGTMCFGCLRLPISQSRPFNVFGSLIWPISSQGSEKLTFNFQVLQARANLLVSVA